LNSGLVLAVYWRHVHSPLLLSIFAGFHCHLLG
jgi:hypothetical protein